MESQKNEVINKYPEEFGSEENWNMPSQNMLLWPMDHFELKAIENQLMEEDLPEVPYLTKSRNFWEMRTAINPLSREFYGHEDSGKSALRLIHTNKPY